MILRDLPVSASIALGLKECTIINFFAQVWKLNFGLYVCKASTLMTRPSPQPSAYAILQLSSFLKNRQ